MSYTLGFFFFLFNIQKHTWHCSIQFFNLKAYDISTSKILTIVFTAWTCKLFTITKNVIINIFAHVPFCTCALSSILPSLWPAWVWAPVYGGCCGWTPGGWAVEEEEAMLSGVPDRSSAGALGGPGWSWKLSSVSNTRSVPNKPN